MSSFKSILDNCWVLGDFFGALHTIEQQGTNKPVSTSQVKAIPSKGFVAKYFQSCLPIFYLEQHEPRGLVAVRLDLVLPVLAVERGLLQVRVPRRELRDGALEADRLVVQHFAPAEICQIYSNIG